MLSHGNKVIKYVTYNLPDRGGPHKVLELFKTLPTLAIDITETICKHF